MDASVVLIQQPTVDFQTFLGVSHRALGYSPAAKADADPRDLPDAAKFLSCLAALRDQNAPVGLPPHLMKHVTFSAMFAADERDMRDIMECCSGMPSVTADTLSRGVALAVVTGTLDEWRDAVIAGVARENDQRVRAYFCQLQSLFEGAGLNVWDRYDKKATDALYYLELK